MLVEIWGFSASSLHLRRPHFRFPRNEVIQDDCWKWRGRHFPPPPQLGSKSSPQVLVDVISVHGGATSNVWRTSEFPGNSQKGVVLVQKHPLDLWSYFFFTFWEASDGQPPQPFLKWLRELPTCHYGEVDQYARVNTTFHEMWCWLRQAPALLFFWILWGFF